MSYGDDAVAKVVRHLRRWIKDQGSEHPEVWGPIWEATWKGTLLPPALKIVRGDAPWERAAETGALARDGGGGSGTE
jgi:hypothetical protein